MSIQLSISLLMSDRPETAEKCLASLKPLLKELNSELIVVFTGRNQDILKLIQQYTSHIIPFAWCNDFSKARNAGLQEAKGEWFLYLDDDEWFEDTDEIIQFFKSGEYTQYQSALYVVRNYLDWDASHYKDSDVGRMCRLTPETKFVYPIHENLDPFSEPYKYFRTFVHHFGYVENNISRKISSKNSRNLPLLLDNYQRSASTQCCMQIVQEYATMEEYDNAITYCHKGLELSAKEGSQIESHELWMQVNLPVLISSLGDYKSALKEGETLLASPRTLEVGKAYLYVTLVDVCRHLNQPQKGLHYIQHYHKIMEYLRRHPEKADRQKCLDITFSGAEARSAEAYISGLFFAADIEDWSLLREILAWIPWDDKALIQPFYSRLDEWKQTFETQEDIILEGFFRLKVDNAYVNFQKSLYAAKNRTLTEAESYWKKCAADCTPDFQAQLAEAGVKNGFSLRPILEDISLTSWTECADELAEKINVRDMPSFFENILSELHDYPLCVERLRQRFLEKQLRHGFLETSRVTELLEQYCESVITEAKALYRDDVLNDVDSYVLPPLYKFAFAIQDVLRFIENGNLTGCIPLLKKAIRIYPQMSTVIRRLIQQIDEQVTEPKQTVSEEFAALGGQVKQVLTGLMANRQWGEAYGVVSQLIPLLPDDLEILRLKQEILGHLS